MRTFLKSGKLENVLYDVRGPVVDEASRMEEQGMSILKLNIGNPAPFGFRAPEEVIQDMRDNIVHCQGYSDSRGIFAARKAVMQYAQLKHIPNVEMKDIFTGNGASELIQLSLHALLNPGDEVLIPSPDYPLWTACTNLAGGTAVHYICDESSDWYPDIDDMERKVTPKTKAIGKDYIAGINMLSNMRLCSNVPGQSIIQTALGGYQSVNEYTVPGGRIYEQREFIYKALNDIPGISAVKPKAAFYIFPKIDVKKFNITDDSKFALDFLKEKRVLLVPGSGFNWKQPDHFRVVYLPRIHDLKMATDKLADFLSYYRQ